MEVVLAITTMITTTNIPSCNILFPAPPRFGIDGNPPPPRSNLVVVGIFSPSAAHALRDRAAQPLPLIRRKRTLDFLADPHSWFACPVFPSRRPGFAGRHFPQPYHNI